MHRTDNSQRHLQSSQVCWRGENGNKAIQCLALLNEFQPLLIQAESHQSTGHCADRFSRWNDTPLCRHTSIKFQTDVERTF